MKNIKPIEEFLLETLGDNWRESVDLKPIERKYFNQKTHSNYNELLNDVVDYIFKNARNNEEIKERLVLFKFPEYFGNLPMYKWKSIEEVGVAKHKDLWVDFDDGGQLGEQMFLLIDEDEIMLPFKKWLIENVSDFLDFISNREFIEIYREIKVDDKWVDNIINDKGKEIHLGIYWTWDEGYTYAYWGDGKVDVNLKTRVKVSDINIFESFLKNIIREDEKEINLFPNTPLELISITIDDEEVNLSNFKNKEIYA